MPDAGGGSHDMSAAEEVIEILKGSEKGTKPYYATATVLRVSDGTTYVHILGGAPETPAISTVSCKPGDQVTVLVSGGKVWIIGNATAPPTDDTAAKEADKKAEEAQITAADALTAALKGIKLNNVQAKKLTQFFADFIQDGLLRGDKVKAEQIDAKKLNTDAIFSKDITATGTITGAHIKGGIYEDSTYGFKMDIGAKSYEGDAVPSLQASGKTNGSGSENLIELYGYPEIQGHGLDLVYRFGQGDGRSNTMGISLEAQGGGLQFWYLNSDEGISKDGYVSFIDSSGVYKSTATIPASGHDYFYIAATFATESVLSVVNVDYDSNALKIVGLAKQRSTWVVFLSAAMTAPMKVSYIETVI